MNIRNALNIAVAIFIGTTVGASADRYYLFGPRRAAIDVDHFTAQLMEKSATLAVLKRNDIACAKKDLTGSISIDIEGADFYRNYASKDAETLKRLEKSINFAKEVLQTQDQGNAGESRECSKKST